MKGTKKGISLVVLVITIIVMLILGGAVIISLGGNSILDRAEEAVEKTNIKQVQEIATKSWVEAYADGARTQEEFEAAVSEGLTGINISKYAITITTSGVNVYNFPTSWRTNVTTIVDGVPIPKGFVASPYTGENKKESGLVIYELESEETQIPDTEDKFTSWTERNQYVWVPVDDFTKFVRQNFGRSYSIVTDDIGVEGYWEAILDETNMPDAAKNAAKSSYMTVTTPDGGITNTLAEVQAMYESVKEYGGFYIARYEAGINVEERRTSNDGVIIKTVHSKMNKTPYNYIRWAYDKAMNKDATGAVEVARSIYPVNSVANTTGVVSTLTYGVQWDRTLAWFIETNAMTLNEVSGASSAYGNFSDHDILSYNELNMEAQYSSDNGKNYNNVTENYTKGSATTDESHLLTTGALKAARINNIYDMAGNLYEWTMEGKSYEYHIYSGGSYYHDGVSGPISLRDQRRLS